MRGKFVDIFVEPDTNEPSGYRFPLEEGGVIILIGWLIFKSWGR